MKTKEQILEHLKARIEDVSLGEISAASVQPCSRIIGDLGLDSMDYATIMLSTEQWLGMKIREDGVRWAEVQTVEQLADLFLANIPE